MHGKITFLSFSSALHSTAWASTLQICFLRLCTLLQHLAQTMNAAMETQVRSQTRFTKFLLLILGWSWFSIASKFSSFYLPAYLGDSCIPAPAPITHIKSVANSRLTNGVIMWLCAENKNENTKIWSCIHTSKYSSLTQECLWEKHLTSLAKMGWALFQVFLHLTTKDYLCMFDSVLSNLWPCWSWLQDIIFGQTQWSHQLSTLKSCWYATVQMVTFHHKLGEWFINYVQ